MGCRAARSIRHGRETVSARRSRPSRAWPLADSRAGQDVRRVPHRPASGRGRSRAEAVGDRAGSRGRRSRRRRRRGRRAFSAGRARRYRLAALHVRAVPLVHHGPRKPLPARAFHRLGRRRGIRGVRGRRRAFRLPNSRRIRRCDSRAVVVRGHYRLSRAPPIESSEERHPGHLWLRWFSTPRRADCVVRRRDRARVDSLS